MIFRRRSKPTIDERTPPSATELRTAARTLRAAADAAHRASPAPWSATGEHVVRCADGMIVADRSSTDHAAERADLPYIAAMDPEVGKALAYLLDLEETYLVGAAYNERLAHVRAALAIARLINGGEQQ